MDFQANNKQLKFIAIGCLVISVVMPVPISLCYWDNCFDHAGIWYLLLGWYVAFSIAGISWWSNIFLLLGWFSQKNLKLPVICNLIAVFLALTFIGNAHTFKLDWGIVGGSGTSSLNVESVEPGAGYVFWLVSLIIFLWRSIAKFLNDTEIVNKSIP